MLVLAMMEAPITQPEQNALYAQFQEEYLNVVAPQGLSVEEALSQRLANLTFLGDDTVTQEAQSPVVEEPLSYQELMRAADAFLVQYLRLNSDAQEEDIRNIHTNYVNSDAAGRAGMEEALAWQGIAQQAAPPRAQAQEVHPNSSRNPLIHSPMNHASTQIQLGMGQAPAVAEAHSGTMSREEYMRRIYCAHDGDESLVLAAGFAYEEAEENPDEMRQLINDLCEMEASKARNTPFSRRR